MADILTQEQRHRKMAAVRQKNTAAELAVQKIAEDLGLRYELHRDDLPGVPDLVLPTLQTVVFVHGCFWHMHDCLAGRATPRTNAEFWRKKRWYNMKRDERNIEALERQGWRVLVLWECEATDDQIEARLISLTEENPVLS